MLGDRELGDRAWVGDLDESDACLIRKLLAAGRLVARPPRAASRPPADATENPSFPRAARGETEPPEPAGAGPTFSGIFPAFAAPGMAGSPPSLLAVAARAPAVPPPEWPTTVVAPPPGRSRRLRAPSDSDAASAESRLNSEVRAAIPA